MQWEIVCYNGESYKSACHETLIDFLARWSREFLQTELNIKYVICHH